jgi:hypothetical protein
VENEKRDRVRGTKEEQEWYGRVGENFQFQDLTDVENIHFRYLY